MQHLLFSLLSAIIGLNFIAASAIYEKGETPVLAHYDFQSIPQREVRHEEKNPVDQALGITIQITAAPVISITPTVGSKAQEKVEAYNTHSEKVIGAVSENAVEHAKALLPCSDPNAICNPTSTPSATLSPTGATLTPTPSVSLTLTPTIDPDPTMPYPIDLPPCDPRFEQPVKENIVPQRPCIY